MSCPFYLLIDFVGDNNETLKEMQFQLDCVIIPQRRVSNDANGQQGCMVDVYSSPVNILGEFFFIFSLFLFIYCLYYLLPNY